MAGPSPARISASGKRFARALLEQAQEADKWSFDAHFGPATLRLSMDAEDDLAHLIYGAFLPVISPHAAMNFHILRRIGLDRLPSFEWARGWIDTDQTIPEEITHPYRVLFDRQVGIIYVLNKESKAGAVWIRRQSELDLRSFITPFRTMLSWFAELVGGEIVHGAGVVVNGVGMILSGPSGSGKSTTAIALAQSGHELIADDCVLVQKGHIHAVYARTKVDRRLGLPFSSVAIKLQRLRGVANAKDFFTIEDSGLRYRQVARVQALAFPSISPMSGYVRIPSERARRLLTRDSLREIRGGNQGNLLRLSHLAIRYPAFRALLPQDFQARVSLFEEMSREVLQFPEASRSAEGDHVSSGR